MNNFKENNGAAVIEFVLLVVTLCLVAVFGIPSLSQSILDKYCEVVNTSNTSSEFRPFEMIEGAKWVGGSDPCRNNEDQCSQEQMADGGC